MVPWAMPRKKRHEKCMRSNTATGDLVRIAFWCTHLYVTMMRVNQSKRTLVVFVATMSVLLLCSSFLASLPGSAEDEVAHLEQALAQHRFLAVDETAASASRGHERALLKMLPYGGRLGDQMFMAASTLAVASRYKMNHCMMRFSARDAIITMFARDAIITMFVGPFEFCEDEEVDMKWYGRGKEAIDWASLSSEEAAQEGKAIGIYGNMHFADNFMDIKDEVFKAFTLAPEIQTKAEEYLSPYGDAVRVGMHIRRGDKTRMAGKWNVEYYEKAMDYFRKKYAKNGKKIIFFVASDGKDWVEEQDIFRKPDVKLIEGASYQEDMAILINCNHGILSGGGFGFWFAFLGPWQHGGEVIINKNQERWSRLEEWTFIEDVVLDSMLIA